MIANVNYVAPSSRTTPLILASRLERGEIVAKLVAAKASITARDCLGLTALFYASRAGDIIAVNLLKKKSPVNDGSLHEASRNLHSDVVAALLEAKHDANFPCHGKTALQELCVNSNGSQKSDSLEGAIQALHAAKCDPWAEYDGRGALFLALENLQSPVQVAEALLRVFMWKDVNDKKAIFKTGPLAEGDRKVYSATKYLNSEYYRGDPKKILQLNQVLKGKQAIDRYYIEFGPNQPMALQPYDAVNMPTKVEEEDKRRLAIRDKQVLETQDHKTKMERKMEESELKLQISSRAHAQEEYQSDRSHQHKLYQAEETSVQKMDISSRIHAQKEHQSDLTHRHNLHQEQEKSAQKMMVDLRMHAQKEQQAFVVHQQKLAREQEQARQKMINNSNLHAQKETQARITHQNKMAQQIATSKQQVQAIQRKQVATASVQRDKETGRKNMAFIDTKAREIEYRQKLDFQQAQSQQKRLAATDMKAIRDR